jgi:hypothetical protein
MSDESREYKDRVRGVWLFVGSYFALMLAFFVIAMVVSFGPGPANPF